MNSFYKHIPICGSVLFVMAVLCAAHAGTPEGTPLEKVALQQLNNYVNSLGETADG